jgi:hypothetical protein
MPICTCHSCPVHFSIKQQYLPFPSAPLLSRALLSSKSVLVFVAPSGSGTGTGKNHICLVKGILHSLRTHLFIFLNATLKEKRPVYTCPTFTSSTPSFNETFSPKFLVHPDLRLDSLFLSSSGLV